MQFISLTDADTINKIMNSAKAFDEANALKAKARAAGYVNALSLYGVVQDADSMHAEYRRMEVYSKTFWSGRVIELLYRFFQSHVPTRVYTLWLVRDDPLQVMLLGAFD